MGPLQFLLLAFCFPAVICNHENLYYNELEVLECSLLEHVGSVTAQIISKTDPSIIDTIYTRSAGDCKARCMASTQCSSILFSEMESTDQDVPRPGMCYMTNLNSFPVATSSPGFTASGLASSVRPDYADPCAGFSCPANSVCSPLCIKEALSATQLFCVQTQTDAECDQHEQYTNIRHYYTGRVSDSTSGGIVQTISYEKKSDDTMLRVDFHSTLLAHQDEYPRCKRWYFTFNDDECADPAPIDFVSLNSNAGSFKRLENIDGTCSGLGAGVVTIDLRIMDCDTYDTHQGYTGWMNTRQLTVMEILPQTANSLACPGLTSFNYAYKSSSVSVDSSAASTVVYDMNYYKGGDTTTALRIKFQSTLRSHMPSDAAYCVRWAVYVDNVACADDSGIHLRATAAQGAFTYLSDFYRGRTLEAICTGLVAGSRYISIVQTNCNGIAATNWNTGWGAQTRMHVEEIRLNALQNVVQTPDSQRFRNPFTNIYKAFTTDNLDTDDGVLKTYTFTKKYEHTALRLTASGSHASFQTTTDGNRWFFTIDAVECGSPGTIEGVAAFNNYMEYFAPMHVSGICTGIAAGAHTIDYRVGGYNGGTAANAATGDSNAFLIVIEEVSLVDVQSCTNASPSVCL